MGTVQNRRLPTTGHTWRGGHHSFCRSNQQPYRHVDKTEDTGPLPLAKSVTLATFFGYTTETLFDPRVVYDSTWNR